jgi:ornithine carbamoyltransferase
MFELGGNSIYLGDVGLDKRESIKDIAKSLSRYLDIVVLRTFSHNAIIEFAKNASIPVINGLSDLLHPSQVISDLYTIRERFGNLKGVNLAYIGDGNNVCHSLLYGCSKTQINLSIATPKGYEPNSEIVREAKSSVGESKISICNDPKLVVKDADIIYTDVWVSMGKESEREERKKIFRDFQVNRELVSLAKKNCLIMHCLPAHRGEEITDEVIDSKNSIVFDQAENRLHVQKAILIKLLR